ncbi:MAG: hypothetical protein EOO05_16265 [Chitinophagaceae bacterium]|nr:MAG: hypothetical protein EOO05_16265 [Chitinophagaceae bacterium]
MRPFRPSFLYNGGAARLDIYLQETSGQFDSLHINLPGQFATDALFAHGPWREAPFLRFSVPVKKNFTSNDFLAMAGKVFPQPGTMVTMSMGQQAPSAPDAASVSGTGKIYFVRLERAVTSDPQDEFSFSGLFEGNIGDSILVSKGRFDYKLRDTDNNIPR